MPRRPGGWGAPPHRRPRTRPRRRHGGRRQAGGRARRRARRQAAPPKRAPTPARGGWGCPSPTGGGPPLHLATGRRGDDAGVEGVTIGPAPPVRGPRPARSPPRGGFMAATEPLPPRTKTIDTAAAAPRGGCTRRPPPPPSSPPYTPPPPPRPPSKKNFQQPALLLERWENVFATLTHHVPRGTIRTKGAHHAS